MSIFCQANPLDKIRYRVDNSLTMNKLILMSLALAMPAFAGTSTTVQTNYEPAPSQEGIQWFAGASAVYLFDYEEVLYTGNVGVKSPWSPLGFATSFFIEGGFLEQDNDGLDNLGLGVSGNIGIDVDLKVVPVTANVKFEKALNDHFGLYLGGGVGAAHSELTASSVDFSDSEWVFTAQVFAGVNFRINDHAEIYTGARWVYFDDADEYSLDDDFGAELGFRWHF
jgi:opacity protein-like surface antigen